MLSAAVTMARLIAFLVPLVLVTTPASATDFGIRMVGQTVVQSVGRRIERSISDIREAAQVASRFGRISSTLRSVAHNRAVGGVPNSYHLKGHALDVVRRRDVSHWQIAAALHQAGFHLIESLDEGDHSHFAFGSAQAQARVETRTVATHPAEQGAQTDWGIVEVRNPPRRSPTIRL